MEPNNTLTDITCGANVTEILNYASFEDGGEHFIEQYKLLCGVQKPENTSWLETLWLDYPEYMYPSQFLRLYVPPCLLIIGTLGNILSFLILIRKRASTYLYLAVLAVLDILVLYVGLMRLWIAEFTVDLQNTSNWLCKAVNYLGYVSSDCSVWIIIAVTFERFVAVCLPLKAPQICKRARAKIIISVCILSICTLNCPMIWAVELQTTEQSGSNLVSCRAMEGYETLINRVWPWVDAAVYSIIPFLLLTCLNSLIIRACISALKRRRFLQIGSSFEGSFRRDSRQNEDKHFIKRSMSSHQNMEKKRLVVTLLAVSFTFLITALPMNILQILTAFYGVKKDIDPVSYAFQFAEFTLVRTVVELLMYVNHTVNFFYYCINGRKFRRELKTLTSPKSACTYLVTGGKMSAKPQIAPPTAQYKMILAIELQKNF